MGKKLRKHSAELKFRIVIESIRNNKVAEVARRYSVHPNQLSRWRQEFLQRGEGIFELRGGTEAEHFRKRIAQLEGLVGKKEVELAVLRKCLDHLVPSRWSLIEYARSTVALGRIGINAICRLLGISKKSFYASRSREDGLKVRHEMLLQMIRAIVEQHPCFGYRRIKSALSEGYGIRANHKLVKKLLLMLPRQGTRSNAPPTRMLP
jgi:transposase-like protein